MVMEAEGGHASQWAAIVSVAEKIGCSPETLRSWLRRVERDTGNEPGATTAEQDRVKELERENRELRRANEILRAERRARRAEDSGVGQPVQQRATARADRVLAAGRVRAHLRSQSGGRGGGLTQTNEPTTKPERTAAHLLDELVGDRSPRRDFCRGVRLALLLGRGGTACCQSSSSTHALRA